MKKYLLFFILLIAFFQIKAQDPVFDWAISYNGGENRIFSLDVDNDGNIYSIGDLKSKTDFDPSQDSLYLTATNDDVFITKMDIYGKLKWANKIGGMGSDLGRSLVVDDSANIYVAGYFENTVDFDPGSGIYNLTADSTPNIFVLKLDSSGQFKWAKKITAWSYISQKLPLTLDNNGNILLTGTFRDSAIFENGLDTVRFNSPSNTDEDIFILKMNFSGDFIWIKQIGGLSEDIATSIAADGSGNVYAVGNFLGTTDFDPDTGTFVYNTLNRRSGFILKLDVNGNFVYAKRIGNSAINSIALDKENNIYTTGNCGGTVDFNPNSGIHEIYCVNSLFLLKLDSNTNFQFVNKTHSTNVNGRWGSSSGHFLAVDDDNNILVTGQYKYRVHFDPSNSSFFLTSYGDEDIFLVRYKENGSFYGAYSTSGSMEDRVSSLKINNYGDIVSSGSFRGGIDCDPDSSAYWISSSGGDNSFIQMLSTKDIKTGSFISPNLDSCNITNENAIVTFVNNSIYPIDFGLDTAEIKLDVTGVIPQSLQYTISDNSINNGVPLNAGDSIKVNIGIIDMSAIGAYNFTVSVTLDDDIDRNNDTLRKTFSTSISAGKVKGPDTVCGSTIVNLKAINSVGALQWQRLTGNLFIDEIAADSAVYEVNIDSTARFRVVSCGVSYSDTITIHFLEKPLISSIRGDSAIINCGEVGITYLIASRNDTSSSVNWYSDSLSNSPLFIGDTFKFELNTSIQSSDSIFLDTFYVSALSPNGCESPRKAVVSRIQCSLVSDLSIIEINNPTPATNNSCYSNSEKVEIAILNTGNFPIDFSIDTMYVQLNIAGATSLYSSIEVSDNSLNNGQLFQVGDTLNIIIDTIDMTSLGNYKFEVFIKSNSNFIYYNDTIRKTFINNIAGGKLSILSAGTICGSDTVIINTQGAKGDLIWQRLVGGVFVEDTGIYSYTFMSYLYTIIDSTTTFRVQSCDQVFSDTITIVSNQLPSPPTVFGDTTFGTCVSNAPAVLTASSPVGSLDLYWYRDSLARDYSYIGDTLILPASNSNPYLPKTDTFYVATIDTATGCFSEKAMVIGKNYTKINPEEKFYFISEDFRAGISPNWQNLGGVKWDFGNINSNNIDGTPMVFSMKDGFKDHEVAMLISPEINAIPGTKLILEFDYNYKHANDGSFRIDVYDGTWKNILKVVTDNCGNWNCSHPHAVLDISEYINSSLKIRFRFREGDYSNPNWIALDNIKVYSLPFELGSDTVVCNNSNFTLDAGNMFTSYMWNTGDTTQTIKPVPSINEYIVSATNSFGCTAVDSIYIRVDKCNTQTYLFENFNSGIPSSWTNTAVTGSFDWMQGVMYDVTDTVNASFDSTAMVYFNDDSLGVSHLNNTVELITPILSPLKKFPLLLGFDYNFRDIKGPSDYFRVELYDGTNWINLMEVTTDDCGRWFGPCISNHAKAHIDITNYINDSLQVKFTYHDGNEWAYWAAFDNVHIYSPDSYYPIATINSVDSVGVADSLYVRGWTSGTVAGIDLDSNDGYSFTIIDQSTAVQEGIFVYSPIDIENYVVSEGDSLLLFGRVEQSKGIQQFVPDSIVVLDSNKNLPAYRIVSSLNESTESQLIRVENFMVVSSFIGSHYYGLSNGTDTIVVKTEEATDVNDQTIFGLGQKFCQINGIGGQIDVTKPFLSGYYITPMHTFDIVLSPQINLGNDTLVCTSANFSLDAGPGFSSYSWNTGDTSQSIQVSQNDSLYIITAIDANGCKAIDSILVHVDVCAALKENVQNASLEIYPNPSKGIFIIEGNNLQSDTELQLMDYKGKMIRSFKLIQDSNFKKEMDLSALPKGMYFIRITNKNLFEVRKIVLQ